MGQGIAYGFLSHHSPRTFNEETAAPVFRPLIDGMYALGNDLAELDVDVIVAMSTRWFSTFPWYVAANAHWEGTVCADDCPDIVNGYSYSWPGHPELAHLMAKKGKEAGVFVNVSDIPEFSLDYGIVVPLKYMQRHEKPFPVVPLSVCMRTDHNETELWGRAIGEAIKESGLRVAFLASGSLSHDLVRGPEKWPAPEQQATDKYLIELLENGQFAEARELAERYGHRHFEGWGKHITALCGVLSVHGEFRGRSYCYGPSSGSGNTCMSLVPA